MSRLSKLVASATDPASGWDARLWGLWAFYSALAYAVILAVILVFSSLGLDVTRIALDARGVGTLLIATAGATLYGGVLGALQWRVLRERLTIPRRRWVLASLISALIVWIVVIVPAVVAADSSDGDLRLAYLLAVSQALALGPLLGLTQANALRPYTRRWKSWVAANILSWLFVQAIFYLASLVVGAFDFAHAEGSPLEAFVILIAATPLTGRWLLWITAPGAVRP